MKIRTKNVILKKREEKQTWKDIRRNNNMDEKNGRIYRYFVRRNNNMGEKNSQNRRKLMSIGGEKKSERMLHELEYCFNAERQRALLCL